MTLLIRSGSGTFLSFRDISYRHPPLIPDGTVVRGANLAVWFPEVDTPDEGSDWSALWRVWNWNRIQNQLDDVATVANCVRTLGSTHVVTSGNITLATYLGRWKQYLDHCVTLGLYMYPCGGDFYHWGADTTYAASAAIYTAWAELLSEYDNIIGVDVTNEAWGAVQRTGNATYYTQPEPYIALLHNLGRIVRKYSGKPVTHSMYATPGQPFEFAPWLLCKQYEMSDFIDIHIYIDGATTDNIDTMMARPWCQGKKLIIGEFGGFDTTASAHQVTRIEETSAIVNANDTVRGALYWAGADLGTSPEGGVGCGLFDNSRAARTAWTTPFATLPITR